MLHILTSHSLSSRWIEIQARHLQEHISVPFQTWGAVPLEESSQGGHFDHLIAQKGPEASRLNHLAVEVCEQAEDEDQLMFLSPDAFPIADPMEVVSEALSRAALVAVQRVENEGERQPHPCFCVTTVSAWRQLAGDWSDGYPWPDRAGRPMTHLGGNLLRRLELTGTPWVQLHRSNRHELDPLYFAIYGGIVYHHGSGELTRAHRTAEPRPLSIPSLPGLSAIVRKLGEQRLLAWERAAHKRFARHSAAIFSRVEQGGSSWLTEVAGTRLGS